MPLWLSSDHIFADPSLPCFDHHLKLKHGAFSLSASYLRLERDASCCLVALVVRRSGFPRMLGGFPAAQIGQECVSFS